MRLAIRMSQRQMADRMNISAAAVQQMEEREQAGTISLKVMRSVADAMDMTFVYAFIPKEGSLEELFDNQAMTVARKRRAQFPERLIRRLADSLKEKPRSSMWEPAKPRFPL